MEAKNTVNEDMETVNALKNEIMAKCPIHKVNLTIETPQAVAGMYLLTLPKAKDILADIVDLSDLHDETLLFITNRQIAEVCQIMYGILAVLEKQDKLNALGVSTIISRIYKIPTVSTYTDFVEYVESICHAFLNEIPQPIYGNLEYIMKNIWFVPYGKIDELANTAIREFQNATGDTNE